MSQQQPENLHGKSEKHHVDPEVSDIAYGRLHKVYASMLDIANNPITLSAAEQNRRALAAQEAIRQAERTVAPARPDLPVLTQQAPIVEAVPAPTEVAAPIVQQEQAPVPENVVSLDTYREQRQPALAETPAISTEAVQPLTPVELAPIDTTNGSGLSLTESRDQVLVALGESVSPTAQALEEVGYRPIHDQRIPA